ncbi:MAG: hypothetical protein IKT39_00480 [Clostridia bacterium]|nr:hypothetical protein [Clostridia bacterium]
MKKILSLLLIFCTIVFTGCESGMDRILYPGGTDALLYYDSYADVKNRIKREDVKRENYYNDLFLTEGIEAKMDTAQVLYKEHREAMLDVSTADEVFFMPSASGATALTEWINQSTVKYTFDQEGIVSTYELKNSKSNNTYVEYLYIMRALSLKYGECTTEIYKDEDNIINNTKIREDYKDVEDVVEFYEETFADGDVSIVSQWVNDGCIITVDFRNPANCSVVYELVEQAITGTEETKE